MTISEIVFRLVIAAVFGAVLGVNRNLHGKAAGLRTHALVSLGAALTVLTADLLDGGGDSGAVSRAIQGIMAGVGFLGAGTILKTQTNDQRGVRGLTTAAAIWTAATFGMAAGAGYWLPALIALLLALFVLVVGKRIEMAFDRALGGPAQPGERIDRPSTHGDR